MAADERAGLKLAIKVRSALLLVILTLMLIDLWVIGRAQLFNLAIVGVFLALGLVEHRLLTTRPAQRLVPFAMVLLDCLLFGVVLLLPNPWLGERLPPAVHLHGSAVLYLLVFLVQRAFTLRPLLVLWAGVSAVLGWGLVLGAAILDPGTEVGVPDLANADAQATLEIVRTALYDEDFVHIGKWLSEAALLLLIAAGLAAAVARSRRLVLSRAMAERGRANLARYFSPLMVDRLANRDRPLDRPERQEVAVLFADLEGFTSLVEAWPAERVMEFLRGFHGRMEEAVFTHGGTLEKFIGDALVASFGVPERGTDDASRALRCAFTMLGSLERWNRERGVAGEPVVGAGIGLHWGSVVMGDIGTTRSMTFTIVGDTVNTASRLESLTRRLGCWLVVSDALVDQVRCEGDAGALALLGQLTPGGNQTLRGRSRPIEIWLGERTATSA